MLASISEDGIPDLQRRLIELTPDACVELPGVGYLAMREYEAYVGRHPRTGEEIPVPAKKVIFFQRAVPTIKGKGAEKPRKVVQVEEKLGAAITQAFEPLGRAFISGVGLFFRHEKPERVGRNPTTGKTMVIPARTVTSFQASPALGRRFSGQNTEPLPDEQLAPLLDGLDSRPLNAGAIAEALIRADRDGSDFEPYPWPLPEALKKVRDACARASDSAQLAFGFLPDEGQVDDALEELGLEPDDSPEWLPFSFGDGEAVTEPHGSRWVLRADEVDQVDPKAFWADPSAHEPWASVPLSVWLRLHAFEALLLGAAGDRFMLSPAQAERTEHQISALVSDFGGLWPEHDFAAALRLPVMRALRPLLPG